MRLTLQIVTFVCAVCVASSTWGQTSEPPADPYLTAAVDALGTGDHELGLELLQKASDRSDDPRITYYQAFALEKLGRCGEARKTYQAAANAGPARFTESALKALQGFDERCIEAVAKPLEPVKTRTSDGRPPRRSHTLATVGWVLTTVGALALIAVPVKIAFDREVATQSEQYFEQVYECDVDFGELADDCDSDAIKSNPQWETYHRRIRTAKQSNVWMIAGGATLVTAGLVAVFVGSSRPEVALVPTPGGAVLSWSIRF